VPYSDQADLELAAGGSVKLRELTDLENGGALDPAAMTAAVAAADALIDAYVPRRYRVPLAAPSAFVVQLSAALAVFELRKRRGIITEIDVAERDRLDAQLKDIARGHLTLGTDPAPQKSGQVVPQVLERSEDEDVSRDSLKGFW